MAKLNKKLFPRLGDYGGDPCYIEEYEGDLLDGPYCRDCVSSMTIDGLPVLNEYQDFRDSTPKRGQLLWYTDMNGEADSPQHCDACGAYLYTQLTGDGEEYVLARCKHRGRPDAVEALYREEFGYLWR